MGNCLTFNQLLMMEKKYELVAWTKNITDSGNARLFLADLQVEMELIEPLCNEVSKCRKELKNNGGMMSVDLARRFAKVYEDSARLDLFMGYVDNAIRFYLQAASYCDRLPNEFNRLCEEAFTIARRYKFEHVLKEEKPKLILQPYLQYKLAGGAV